MDALVSPSVTPAASRPVIWLSGEIVTPINKIGPILFVPAMVGALFGILHNAGAPFLTTVFRPFIAIFVLASAFMVWLCFRLQRVGYSGRELVVSNYLREERIPFDQVEAVEPVWWYYRRMVRVRLRSDGSFGQVIYYIPKWAAFKCMWVAPEKELRALLKTEPDYPPVF